MTRVLGIDPGLAATGFGVVAVEGGRLRYLADGVISTHSSDGHAARLAAIFDRVLDLIATHRPQLAAVETLYFSRNATSAIPVAEARGVVALAFHRSGVPVHELSPHIIKQAVVGSGRAEKRQVAAMVNVVLGLDRSDRAHHASDALAAAIAGAHHRSSPGTFGPHGGAL